MAQARTRRDGTKPGRIALDIKVLFIKTFSLCRTGQEQQSGRFVTGSRGRGKNPRQNNSLGMGR